MARFTVTNKAKADLREIGRFTARRWDKDQRDKYLKMLNEYFKAIASRRAQGMDASEERAGYRKVHVGRHFIYFRWLSDDVVEIVRILHDRMIPEERL